MNRVSFVSDITERYPTRLGSRNIVTTAALDTGGAHDNAALNLMRTDLRERMIYITGQAFWRLSEREGVTFAKIRNDIATVHRRFGISALAVEANNYGLSEIENLRREYRISCIKVHTAGRITSEDVIRRGDNMDKEQIVKKFNSWRQNAQMDPDNEQRLGQVRMVKSKTPELEKLMREFDNFVRVDPKGTGARANPKFGAAGRGHDDGVMSCLLNFHVVTTRVMGGWGGQNAVGGISGRTAERRRRARKGRRPIGRLMGRVRHHHYDGY